MIHNDNVHLWLGIRLIIKHSQFEIKGVIIGLQLGITVKILTLIGLDLVVHPNLLS